MQTRSTHEDSNSYKGNQAPQINSTSLFNQDLQEKRFNHQTLRLTTKTPDTNTNTTPPSNNPNPINIAPVKEMNPAVLKKYLADKVSKSIQKPCSNAFYN
jgi:hypothetical protein